MRFNGKRLPKTREELDQFVRQHGLRPYGVLTYRGRDIFIAETELEMDRPVECPWGYYQAAWFVNAPDSNDKMDIGRWIDFDAMHDMDKGWTTEEKRQARIQTILEDAQDWINKSIEKGRLDA